MKYQKKKSWLFIKIAKAKQNGGDANNQNGVDMYSLNCVTDF